MKTVKVKVFVNVASDGNWIAVGEKSYTSSDARHEAEFDLDECEDATQQGYWIEVELPIPPKKNAVKKESFNVTVTKD